MATTTFHEYTGDGSDKTFDYSFPTYFVTEVKVQVDGVIVDNYTVPSWASSGTKTVTFDNSTGTVNTTVCEADGSPKTGLKVRVYRDTDIDAAKATYTAGSSVKADDLNNNQTQLLRALQEEQFNTITATDIADDAITASKIKDGAVNHEQLATDAVRTVKIQDGAVNRDKIANNAIDSDQLTTNAVTTDKIDDDAVTAPKIANNAIDSDQLTTNAVTTDKIDDDAVTAPKIANNAVNHEQLAEDAVRSVKIQNLAVTENKIAANAVTATKLATNSVDFGAIAANAVRSDEIQAGAVIEDKLGENSVTAVKIADGAVNHEQLATDAVRAAKIQNNAVETAKIADNAVTMDKIADATIVIDTEQAAHIVDNDTFFTTKAAEARYFNASTSETIKDGDTFPDNDTTIATTAAINDRIIDLVDDVGGFVPIANETSFPTTNPDVNNGPGTIVSIKAIASSIVLGNTTNVVITNGAGLGNNVTISGLTANTTYASGFGMLVETTSTLHTYNFHRLVPKATEVSTVAGSIANVNTIAANNANITTVADDLNESTSEINTVAVNITNVNNVGNSIANVDIIAANNANITTVANDLNESTSEIDLVATNITNVNNVGSNISSINNCNTNLTAIEHYGDTYQIGTGAPTQRPDGTSLVIGDLWFDSSSNKSMMVRDGSSGDGYAAVTPSQSVLDDIAIVSGNITYAEDLGSVGDALSTGTGNSIETAADNIANIQRLGTADAVADMAILATTDIVADMNTLATTDIVADMDALGPKATEIGRLGTADAVADMALLGTTACVADMAILGTTDVVSDMNTLATSDVVADMNTLATSDIVSDMNTLATSGNVTAMDNCSGSISNINTVSGSISNVNTAAGSISNVNTVASSIADVNRYANEYKIASSAPGSPSEGDLWYDDTNNILKYRSNSAWESISSGGISNIVEDTSPQLGGDLDTNSFEINLDASHKVKFGSSSEFTLMYDGSNTKIASTTGNTHIETAATVEINKGTTENMAKFISDGACEFYHNNAKKLETTSTGTTVTGLLTATTIDGSAGSNLTLDFGTL